MAAAVKITNCSSILRFVKAISKETGTSLQTAKNIADLIRDKSRTNLNGTLQLNDSSITEEEWKYIANTLGNEIEWTYV